ncbi:MAG: hypothetical protein DIU72_003285 [Pseudomonadota bacterium]|nr:MAG: hypothetical protein DIU72_06645 [Pseudomonadota bacterium]
MSLVGREDRWQHLVRLAFRLSEALAGQGETEGPARLPAPRSNRGGARSPAAADRRRGEAAASAAELGRGAPTALAKATSFASRRALEAALQALDSALEVFGPEIDPVDDFEGYAVRRLALALRDALHRALDSHQA